MEDKTSNGRFFFGWFVLLGSVLIVTVSLSTRYSFSLFYPQILSEFGWSRAGTAGALSLSLIVFGISSPTVGVLVDKFGPRRILIAGLFILTMGLVLMSVIQNMWLFYIAFGLVTAIGINALGFVVHTSYLSQWFIQRRGLAMGILFSSVGAASLLAGGYQYFIDSFGWRPSYLCIGLINIGIVLPCIGFLIRRSPEHMGLLPDGTVVASRHRPNRLSQLKMEVIDKNWANTDWTLKLAFRTQRFWTMFIAFVGSGVVLNLMIAHQSMYSLDIGSTPLLAASVLSLTGGMTIAGSIANFVSDRIGREVTYTIGAIGSVLALIFILYAAEGTFGFLYVYAVLWGLFFGVIPPVILSGSADAFIGKHLGSINGFLIMAYGIGGSIGPWLGGYVHDISGSYRPAFIIVMGILALSCAFFWASSPRRVRRRAN